MIFIEFLLAPTVPSDPRPQNLQLVVPAGVVSISSLISSDKFVTSSQIPIVNLCFGLLDFAFS